MRRDVSPSLRGLSASSGSQRRLRPPNAHSRLVLHFIQQTFTKSYAGGR